MSDQGFREVQLSGKQVVFLFMFLAVLLIGTFLLGVSVGRHAEPDSALLATPTPAATVTDSNPAAPLPPPTTLTPGELDYHKTLQGGAEGKKAAVPTPSVSAAPATTPSSPASVAAPKTTPTPPPAAKPTPPPASGTAVWYIQVNSFSTLEHATKQVSDLKAKGVTATVFNAPGGGAHYRVRVGPLEPGARDAMVLRLQKLGFKPRVTR